MRFKYVIIAFFKFSVSFFLWWACIPFYMNFLFQRMQILNLSPTMPNWISLMVWKGGSWKCMGLQSFSIIFFILWHIFCFVNCIYAIQFFRHAKVDIFLNDAILHHILVFLFCNYRGTVSSRHKTCS